MSGRPPAPAVHTDSTAPPTSTVSPFTSADCNGPFDSAARVSCSLFSQLVVGGGTGVEASTQSLLRGPAARERRAVVAAHHEGRSRVVGAAAVQPSQRLLVDRGLHPHLRRRRAVGAAVEGRAGGAGPASPHSAPALVLPRRPVHGQRAA